VLPYHHYRCLPFTALLIPARVVFGTREAGEERLAEWVVF